MSKVIERRKLLQEMKRVFKLIKEGLDEFDAKFEEAKQAPTKQMKEKFTDELAKKLTKLKRFRENVIAWTNHRDCKERMNELEEMRLDIEMRMEAYRAMEKEDKIKPFSERALEMEPKVAPKEKEREEIIGWFRTTIYDLNQQCEPWEAESEKLGNAGATTAQSTPTGVQSSKRNRDKSRSSNRVDYQLEKIDALTKRIEQNRSHVAMLELILRALHNDCLTVDDLRTYDFCQRVQKFVDEQNSSKNLLANDSLDLYDEVLELFDNFDSSLLITSPTSGDNKENDAVLIGGGSGATEKVAESEGAGSTGSYDSEGKRRIKYDGSANKGAKSSFTPIRRRQSAPSLLPHNQNQSVLAAAGNGTTCPGPKSTTFESSTNSSSNPDQPRAQPPLQYSAVAASGVRPPVNQASSIAVKSEPADDLDFRVLELSSEPSMVEFSQDSLKQNDSPICSLIESDQELLLWLSSSNNKRAASSNDLLSLSQQQAAGGASSTKSPIDDIYDEIPNCDNVIDRFVDSMFALNPLNAAPLTKEQRNILECLEHSAGEMFLDDPATCAANRTMFTAFQPRAAANTRPYYPTSPLNWMCYQDFYDELKIDTLVCIFYYMERTMAQRGAIASLQKRGWMWHTRDRRWYCRIGERVAVTEDYEEGRFGYIDYEDWETKTTGSNFAFQYRYRGSPLDPLPSMMGSRSSIAPNSPQITCSM